MSKWKPMEDYFIIFDDKTGNKRNEDYLKSMVDEMRKVANNYGFDISQWGGRTGLKRSMAGELVTDMKDALDEIIVRYA